MRKTFPGPSAYPGSEVDRAVHLGDDVAVAARQQVDADEVPGDRRRGLEREALRERRRRRGLARAAERDVRPPLTRGCGAPGGADHPATRDDEAEVPADRWDELLGKHALVGEPREPCEAGELAVELLGGGAENDVPSPAPEARLEHDGKLRSR